MRWDRYVRNVALINVIAGRVRTTGWIQALESLPTAVSVSAVATPGNWLEETTDLLSSPGFVYLAASDPAEVDRDYRRLRQWEADGLYTK